MNVELTQEIVRELLDYDPITGMLTWKRRDRKWFDTDREWKRWNTRYAVKQAFTAINSDGYHNGAIFHKSHSAHRVIFLYMAGRWPDPEVDHENHQRVDNRWENLFETGQNCKNQTLYKNNKTGRVGIYKRSRRRQFTAYIGIGYHLVLGYFDTFEEACAAREAAEIKYGYHEHHGEPSVT